MKPPSSSSDSSVKQTILNLLIIILQQTGRCGKSTFLLALVKWFVVRGVSIQAIDTDSDHRTMSFALPQARQVTLGDEPDGDVVREIYRTLIRAPVTVVDPQAHQKQPFLTALAKTHLLDNLKDAALVVPVFPQDSIDVLEDISDTVQLLLRHKNVQFLVVKVPSKSKSFLLYEGSELQKLLLDTGAKEIEMPTLLLDTRNHLIELELKYDRGISAAEAATNTEIAVDPLHRGVLEFWLNDLFAQFDRAADLLVPTARLEAVKARIPHPAQAILAPPRRARGSLVNRNNLNLQPPL